MCVCVCGKIGGKNPRPKTTQVSLYLGVVYVNDHTIEKQS